MATRLLSLFCLYIPFFCSEWSVFTILIKNHRIWSVCALECHGISMTFFSRYRIALRKKIGLQLLLSVQGNLGWCCLHLVIALLLSHSPSFSYALCLILNWEHQSDNIVLTSRKVFSTPLLLVRKLFLFAFPYDNIQYWKSKWHSYDLDNC